MRVMAPIPTSPICAVERELNQFGVAHRLRVAVDQHHLVAAGGQGLEQEHPEVGHEVLGDAVVGVVEQDFHVLAGDSAAADADVFPSSGKPPASVGSSASSDPGPELVSVATFYQLKDLAAANFLEPFGQCREFGRQAPAMPCWKKMAILLSVSGLRKSFGARTLFENLSLSIADGDRTGLIGPNGGGKTTLLEILAGREAPDAGERALRKQTKMAYVPQDSLFGPEDTVGSVLHAAVDGLPLAEEEKTARIQMMLGRAGFDALSTPASALSGGWKKRLAIAAALVTSPDLLLLDEPTNHLDLEGILWLEKSIQAANACLVVTHDRYFLENVATRMVEVNPVYPQSAFQVKGNYSEFLERREDFLEAQAKQQESLATKVRQGGGVAAAGAESPDRQVAGANRRRRTADRGTGGRHRAQPHGHGEHRLHGVRSQDQAPDRGRGHRQVARRAQAVSRI